VCARCYCIFTRCISQRDQQRLQMKEREAIQRLHQNDQLQQPSSSSSSFNQPQQQQHHYADEPAFMDRERYLASIGYIVPNKVVEDSCRRRFEDHPTAIWATKRFGYFKRGEPMPVELMTDEEKAQAGIKLNDDDNDPKKRAIFGQTPTVHTIDTSLPPPAAAISSSYNIPSLRNVQVATEGNVYGLLHICV
jgi:hypothetical protein